MLLKIAIRCHILLFNLLVIRFGYFFLLLFRFTLFAILSIASKFMIFLMQIDHKIILIFFLLHQFAHRITISILSDILRNDRFFFWLCYSLWLFNTRNIMISLAIFFFLFLYLVCQIWLFKCFINLFWKLVIRIILFLLRFIFFLFTFLLIFLILFLLLFNFFFLNLLLFFNLFLNLINNFLIVILRFMNTLLSFLMLAIIFLYSHHEIVRIFFLFHQSTHRIILSICLLWSRFFYNLFWLKTFKSSFLFLSNLMSLSTERRSFNLLFTFFITFFLFLFLVFIIFLLIWSMIRDYWTFWNFIIWFLRFIILSFFSIFFRQSITSCSFNRLSIWLDLP